MAFGLPHFLLLDNGKPFTSRFFRHFFKILTTENVFKTPSPPPSPPQTNGQFVRYNRTIIAELRHFFKQQPKEWELYSDIHTFDYNTQIYWITNCTLFELVPSQPPNAIIMQPDPERILGESGGKLLHRWKMRLSHLVDPPAQYISSADNVPITVQQNGIH